MRSAETQTEAKPLAEKDSWRPIASFVVDFQIRVTPNQRQEQRVKVHHIESDTCATWSSAEYVQVCQWMLSKLDIPSTRVTPYNEP